MSQAAPGSDRDTAPVRDPSFASRDSFEFGRGISFLDAVYGFAATLLISNVDAPPPDAWRSLSTLAASGLPVQLLGFALSFTVIVVFWRVNVGLVQRLSGLDGPTTVLNLITAALVIVIAFTTQGISDPESMQLALPTVGYALNIALVSLSLLAMFQLARSRGLERVRTTRRENRILIFASLVSPVVFLLSVPVALLVDAQAAKLVWATLLILGPVSGVIAQRIAGHAPSPR